MKSLLDRIDEQYSSFAAGHRKIARYLYDNLREALLLDSVQLAKKCKVSESTVSRFITNIGYSGIKEFKQEVGKLVLKEYSSPTRLDDSNGKLKKSDSILARISAGDRDNVNSLQSYISTAVFDETVTKICAAKTLYIAGLRSNFALAFYFNFHLRYFLKSVVLIQAGCADIPDQMYKCHKGDVLFIISFRRHPQLAIKLVERAKSKGATIITITNHHLSPIGQLADIPLISKTQVQSYIESPTASMALMNALITAVAIRNKKSSMSSLSLLENELNEFEIYNKEFKHQFLS